MRYLILVVAGFCLLCGLLVVESGIFDDLNQTGRSTILLQNVASNQETEIPNATEPNIQQLEAADSISFGADNAPARTITLGSVDPKSGYKYQLELSSKGAAIRKASFSEFDDRDHKNPQPLVIISPILESDGSEVLAMANTNFVFVQQQLQLPLSKLDWKSFDAETADDGSQTARFEAIIKRQDTGKPVIKLTKTYRIQRDSYLFDCDITVENVSSVEQKVRFDLAGPGGVGREAFRGDMRSVVAGFLTKGNDGQIISSRKDLTPSFHGKIFKGEVGLKDTTRQYQKAIQLRDQAEIREAKKNLQIGRNLPDTDKQAHFLWAATSNKYFTAILRPVPTDGEEYCDWVADRTAWFYNPDRDERGTSGDETIGLDLKVAPNTLAAAGHANSSKIYNFQLYVGPKDKSLFDRKELLLFSIGLQFQSDLDSGIISEALREQFKNNSILLSPDVSVSTKEKGEKWLITNNKETYSVSKGESKLDIYRKLYRDLDFVQTVTFMPCCCCLAGIIRPLALGILAIMKWMHAVIPNYGVVIIILVFLMRLAMHPVTKKSQVSMSKMTTLGPKVEEIKKKYANNKAEMNKQMMALYREQGASPFMSFLPMMVQMPIWIALWSAVNASIDLRGAGFLPFWITDLSMPDALVRFSTLTVPLLGWKIESLNLLPILMGVAFYLQQQLMPSQATASTNPQMAQQQKMMKIMMPLLFPLMLYKAPSGVNLYIMSSTFAGVIEQHVIRKHIREKEEAESKGLVAATSKTGGKVKKKKPKPFFRNM